ncbi:hypothetical protein ACFV4I_15775 [Nocardiopsis alba]|uniref:hypothetical protein n=1 Tax=Nocardiopsis TaxID=2013 RepID=UPI002DBB1EBF|nr:hypothetical protein [Nocardiopsis sp. LDBS1602]MEC3895853.1 hypothetical protein [Nocardiopsis sp. LDBS1602]
MSVGLYYTAHRDTPLSDDEHAVLTRIVDEGERALLEEARHRLAEWRESGEVPEDLVDPGEIFEPLAPYSIGERPRELFAGSSRLSSPRAGFETLMAQVRHYLAALTRLREALPDAEWRVHVDDLDVPWVEGRYVLEAKM